MDGQPFQFLETERLRLRSFRDDDLPVFLDYAFFTLDLHWITATTGVLNTPSIRLLERVGFRREGHYLENIWFKGAWGDEYLYALLQMEWSQKRS